MQQQEMGSKLPFGSIQLKDFEGKGGRFQRETVAAQLQLLRFAICKVLKVQFLQEITVKFLEHAYLYSNYSNY